jgi:hypothetical protein
MTETEIRQEFKTFEDAGVHPDTLHIRFGEGDEVAKAEIKSGNDVLFSYPNRFRNHEQEGQWRHFSCQSVT